jgi:hypothetical protein
MQNVVFVQAGEHTSATSGGEAFGSTLRMLKTSGKSEWYILQLHTVVI